MDLETLIKENKLWKFYKCPEWIRLKTQVLQDQHYECQICKSRGIVTRYDETEDGRRKLIQTVHHVNEVRKHPELALSRYYFVDGVRHDNLIAVCKKCHNEIHDRFGGNKTSGFVNTERW